MTGPLVFGWLLGSTVWLELGSLDLVLLPLIAWHEVTQSIFQPRSREGHGRVTRVQGPCTWSFDSAGFQPGMRLGEKTSIAPDFTREREREGVATQSARTLHPGDGKHQSIC